MKNEKWELPEGKAKQIEELKKQIEELEKPDDGELKDLPLNSIASQVIDADAIDVTNVPDDAAMYRERIANIMGGIAPALHEGRFVVGIVRYIDGQMQAFTHRHGVPVDDLETACEKFREALTGERPPSAMTPLPRATVNRPKPQDVLFGKKSEE